MKKLLIAEELGQFILSLYLLFQIPNHIALTTLIPCFFIPDIFAVGFLINNTIGTVMYNFSHHKLVAILLVAIGLFTSSNLLLQIGIIAYSHSCFDRIFGYGLKFMGNPNKTHLGFTGQEKKNNPADHF